MASRWLVAVQRRVAAVLVALAVRIAVIGLIVNEGVVGV